MKKIISFDFITKRVNELVIEKITDYPYLTHIYYEGCTYPIILTKEQAILFKEGHVIELHIGEVAIKLED
jgi:hypothetical protein